MMALSSVSVILRLPEAVFKINIIYNLPVLQREIGLLKKEILDPRFFQLHSPEVSPLVRSCMFSVNLTLNVK